MTGRRQHSAETFCPVRGCNPSVKPLNPLGLTAPLTQGSRELHSVSAAHAYTTPHSAAARYLSFSLFAPQAAQKSSSLLRGSRGRSRAVRRIYFSGSREPRSVYPQQCGQGSSQSFVAAKRRQMPAPLTLRGAQWLPQIPPQREPPTLPRRKFAAEQEKKPFPVGKGFCVRGN